MIVVFWSGCATITYNATAVNKMVAIAKNETNTDYEVVGKFEYKTRAVFLVFSLLTVKDVKLSEEVNKSLQSTGGDAVVNLSIGEVTDIVDLAISWLQSALIFVNIANTRSVTIKGDVVKYKMTSSNIPTLDSELKLAIEKFNNDPGK